MFTAQVRTITSVVSLRALNLNNELNVCHDILSRLARAVSKINRSFLYHKLSDVLNIYLHIFSDCLNVNKQIVVYLMQLYNIGYRYNEGIDK